VEQRVGDTEAGAAGPQREQAPGARRVPLRGGDPGGDRDDRIREPALGARHLRRRVAAEPLGHEEVGQHDGGGAGAGRAVGEKLPPQRGPEDVLAAELVEEQQVGVGVRGERRDADHDGEHAREQERARARDAEQRRTPRPHEPKSAVIVTPGAVGPAGVPRATPMPTRR
jgi:hypothetical protein